MNAPEPARAGVLPLDLNIVGGRPRPREGVEALDDFSAFNTIVLNHE